jgi:RND family efflux transporter MFP subunit
MGVLVAARDRFASGDDEAPVARRPAEARAPAASTQADLFTGVVFARQQVDLAPSAEARIKTLPAQLGARVAKGDVIATLDADSVRRELAAAVAAVRAARAEAQTARVEQTAARDKLHRIGQYEESVSGQEKANAQYEEKMSGSRVNASQARVSEAMARAEQLRLLVENAAVVAPFDGVVAARYVDPGALVGPGKPILRLISGDDLWVRFAVPEERTALVQVKGCVRAAVGSPPIAIPGVVETVAPQVDTALRMLVAEARLQLPSDRRGITAGQAADVRAVPCTTP